MPRTARASLGGVCYHVYNRSNDSAILFHKRDDYQTFLRALQFATNRQRMRVAAYCILPTHFHFVVWPFEDGDLSSWMQRLMTIQVRRFRQLYQGLGHIWQGRFRAFPIEPGPSFWSVVRYVEQNPIRLKLVERAEAWEWSSAANPITLENPGIGAAPSARPADWSDQLHEPMPAEEVERIRRSLNRGLPYGAADWVLATAKSMGIESSLRPRGRPRKAPT